MANYIKIKNSDGKIWILPKTELKTALSLYQPSSKKGKMIKRFLPYIEKSRLISKIVNKILKIENCEYEINSEVDNAIRKVFKLNENTQLYYSIFLGTPCIDQKTTIQIYDKNEILGYCKISDKEHILNIFYKEQELLNYYNDLSVKNIPKCLYCGSLKNSQGIFIQTTTKNNTSKIIHNITEEHIYFLKQFCNKTKIKCKYEESDYYNMLLQLENYYPILNDMGCDLSIVDNMKKKVSKYLEKKSEFYAYHGDFTPWNTFFNKKDIFVFDFEYSRKSFPKYLDLFHFFTQVSIYKRKMEAYNIYKSFLKLSNNDIIKDLFDDIYLYYIMYLLSIICFYLNRDKDDLSNNSKNVLIWVDLLKLLQKNI